jgi:hypothetical protein
MTSVLFIAMLLYPLWGLALLILFCKWLRVHGSLFRRLTVSGVVAVLATALFTLVMWGAEGFAVMAPWFVALVDRQQSGFLWPLAAFVFALALLVNFFSGGKSSKQNSLKPS